MHEDQRRVTLAGLAAGRQEKLAVNGHAVRGAVDHLLRHHQRIGGKVGGNGIGRQIARGAAHLNRRPRRMPGVGMQKRHAVSDEDRSPLDALAGSDGARRPAGHGDAPDVAPVDIVLVRREIASFPSVGKETVSTSKFPGVSSMAGPPSTATE